MRPGDIVKIKLSGDVVDAKVLDCRNRKTIWVEVLWSKTRIHALTPAEKKKVAESPISLDNLSENEKTLAMLAQAGKKVVHQSGAKRIKIPRAKVIDAEFFQPQLSKSVLKRQAIQRGESVEEVITGLPLPAKAAESTPEICPYCGFEIATDDCTCGGLMNILPGGESRLDHLTTDMSAQPMTTAQVTDFTSVEPVIVLSVKDRLKAKLATKKGGD